MSIDEKMSVARHLVLTHTRFHERSVAQSRESLAHDATRARNPRGTRNALHGRWIDFLAGGIVRHLEAATLVSRTAIDESLANVHPHRQRAGVVARVARG